MTPPKTPDGDGPTSSTGSAAPTTPEKMRQIKKASKSDLRQRAALRKKFRAMKGSALAGKSKSLRERLSKATDAEKKAALQQRLRMVTTQRQQKGFRKEYGKNWRADVFGSRKAAKGYMGAYKQARSQGGSAKNYAAINKGNTAYNAALLKLQNKRRKKAGKDPLTTARNPRATNYGVVEDN